LLFDSLAVIFHTEISPFTATDVAWGGFLSLWAIMEYREEAALMMLRDGALLMRGGGRKKDGARTGGRSELMTGRSKRDHRQGECGTEGDGLGSNREL